MVGALTALATFLIAPPTVALGLAGWAVAALVIVMALGAAAWARRSSNLGLGLVMAYVAVGEVAVLEWLAGGFRSPYDLLYLLPIVYVAGVHPAPRLAAFLLVLPFVAALPLAYEGSGTAGLTALAAQTVFWVGFAAIVYQLMHNVRGQRLALRREGAESRRLARLDPLTGVGNRRAFEEALEREVARTRRSGAELAIVIADLDGFKAINDRFGHQAGDECLQAAARTLEDTVRRPDACYRWGGDEFVIILPDTGLADAETVGRRLAQAMSALEWGPEACAASVSIGVAALEPEMDSHALVAAADRRLLAGKLGSPTSEPAR